MLTIALCGAFIAMLLFPYVKNGLWFDDALNSQMWGMLNRFDVGIWDFSVRVSKVWFYEAGRILLCWPVLYGFFYVTREPEIVRLADVALVLTHVGLVARLLREVRIPWSTVGIFVLFLLALFQIRANDDPIAAYASFCQLLGIALTVALLLLVRWWTTGSTLHLAASVTVVILSLLCYELNAVFVPVCMVAILVAPHPHRLRNMAMLLGPFALFVCVNLYAKHGALQPYPGSTFGTLSAIPASYLKQLSAALPGSFYLFRARSDLPPASLLTTAAANPMAWMTAALGLASFWMVAKRQAALSGSVPRGALATAAAFVLLPPVLIAISERYQKFIGWGDAHLPVYYQYFGLAFLAAVIFSWAYGKHRALTLWLVAPLFAVYAALNWTVNLRQVDYLDGIFAEPRSSLVAALKNGLLDPVRDGDVVEIVNSPIFINGNLIYQVIQKRVATPNETASAKYFQSEPSASAKAYRLYRDPVAPHSWRLVASGAEPR